MQTYLYRLYNSSGNLLYLGITGNLDQRFTAHRAIKPWWLEVEEIVIKSYPDRSSAENAERLAILNDHPQYNELVTTKKHTAVPEKRYPTSHSKLSESEILYLRSLDGEDMLLRAAELQAAGWSVAAILEGARVVPTSVQLRLLLKGIYNVNTGVPVPIPPMSKRLKREERLSKITHLTAEQKAELIYYSKLARKMRPQYRADHPIATGSQTYKDLINAHYLAGVSVQEMAKVVGVDEGNIRRRLNKSK
jgi:hypothetical protein